MRVGLVEFVGRHVKRTNRLRYHIVVDESLNRTETTQVNDLLRVATEVPAITVACFASISK